MLHFPPPEIDSKINLAQGDFHGRLDIKVKFLCFPIKSYIHSWTVGQIQLLCSLDNLILESFFPNGKGKSFHKLFYIPRFDFIVFTIQLNLDSRNLLILSIACLPSVGIFGAFKTVGIKLLSF